MSLLRVSSQERTTSPVFIVGEARSGTTILYRTLQKHESFRPKKVNLFESKIMSHADKTSTFGPGEPSSMHGYMATDDERYQAFLKSISSLRPALRLGDLMAPRIGARGLSDLIWAWTGHTHLVRSYFHHAQQARGVRRVLEKTPGHVRHVNRLLRCYPKARLIYIHRHPVDVFTSYRQRVRTDPKSRSWANISLEKFAQNWVRNSEEAVAASERLPDCFLLLRYEDFTADPEQSAKEICDFVSEPYDPEIVIERNPDLTKRKADPHVLGEITTRTKDWADFISRKNADKLQNLVAPTMERLQYERY